MAFSTATARNAAVNGVTAIAGYASLHTGDPGSTGASEATGGSYTRVAVTWPAASSGSATGTCPAHSVPAGTTVTHGGLWTAVSGGSFVTGAALSASETFAGAGTYQLAPTISESAS